MDQYSTQTRKDAEAKIDAEIAKVSLDRREILRSIFASLHLASMQDPARLQTTVARFATLLVALSLQADGIQRWMIRLTWAIAIMTFVLVVLTVIMLAKM